MQNPAHGLPEIGSNPETAAASQAIDLAADGNPHPLAERDHPSAESPRKDSQNSQKSSGAELDRLAAILKAIPAEHRAEFLRGLADQIDGKTP